MKARGLCFRCYERIRKFHPEQLPPTLAVAPSVRFMEKVDTTGACWLWTGGTFPNGYGQFWLDGRNTSAHRASWRLFRGPIPSALVICHRCDTPPCVNPAHLFLGTVGDNNQDKMIKGRASHGAGHHNAKVTDNQVRTIRALWDTGQYRVKDLARAFDVSAATAHKIATRSAWRHVS